MLLLLSVCVCVFSFSNVRVLGAFSTWTLLFDHIGSKGLLWTTISELCPVLSVTAQPKSVTLSGVILVGPANVSPLKGQTF